MLCPQYFFYIVYSSNGLLYFSFSVNPQIDYAYFEGRYGNIKLEILDIPLTIGQADFLKYHLFASLARIPVRLRLLIYRSLCLSLKSTIKLYKRLLSKALVKLKIIENANAKWISAKANPMYSLNTQYPYHKDKLLEALGGRILYKHEILAALKEYNAGSTELINSLNDILQLNMLEGNGETLPSIRALPDGNLTCLRCGQKNRIKQMHCSICNRGDCHYCEECASMGEARSCNPIYVFYSAQQQKDILPKTNIVFPGELTPAQEDAARKLKDFVLSNNSAIKEALVWAACGAGKTEVSFESIKAVLDAGGRVLFAVPRRDVVIELEARLQKAFPDTQIVTLYGGVKEKYRNANLIIATTHQVIRFYESFDLVVLDEMDAFPYQGSEMLQFAVKRAKKPDGRVVFMTATPSSEYLREMAQETGAVIKIPARHHRFPLPVPQMKIGKLVQESEIYLQAMDFIRECVIDGSPVLVFVPSVAIAEKLAAELGNELKDEGIGIDYIHSKDSLRDSKKDSFSKGQIQVLVTTTIMERGITVPRVNVLVALADAESIFNVQSLIQMAGRAGRTTAFPTGKVLFIGAKLTESMREAVDRIESLNREAFQKGYIDVENVS